MKVLFVLTLGLFLNLAANATIRRVGFTDVQPVAGVDYTNFFAAHEAAVAGDTIYVFPGKTICQNGWPTSVGRAEIKKRLVIIGKGNWLDSSSNPRGNVGFQATKGKAYFGAYNTGFNVGIIFYSEAAGSVLMGFDGQAQSILVQCNNLTIKRNFNFYIYLPNLNINNLTIEQNYNLAFSGSDDINSVYDHMTIKNNFMSYFQIPYHSYNGVIANNTWAFDRSGAANGGATAMSSVNLNNYPPSYINLQGGTWLFENNLLVFYYTTTAPEFPFVVQNGDQTMFNDNVATQSSNFTWPTGSNSMRNTIIPVAGVSSIFEAFPAIGTSSADGRYQLSATSLAKAGSTLRSGSSTDAGMFGGVNKYKISTIPSIPTIYSISSPQGNSPTGSTIQVIISTRSNN